MKKPAGRSFFVAGEQKFEQGSHFSSQDIHILSRTSGTLAGW
jgi:hypothetical protein